MSYMVKITCAENRMDVTHLEVRLFRDGIPLKRDEDGEAVTVHALEEGGSMNIIFEPDHAADKQGLILNE